MRIIHEVTLAIFSLLILIVCAVYTLMMFGLVDFDMVTQAHETIIGNNSIANAVIGVNLILVIFALIGIFGDSTKGDRIGDGIVVENEKGNLLISRETLRNLITSAVKGFEDVEINSTDISLTPESKLKINVIISVSERVVIKDLTNSLQNRIREVIKRSSDIDVQLVNIGVKGILKQKSEVRSQRSEAVERVAVVEKVVEVEKVETPEKVEKKTDKKVDKKKVKK